MSSNASGVIAHAVPFIAGLLQQDLGSVEVELVDYWECRGSSRRYPGEYHCGLD